MGADNVLVTGAATAYKDRESGADVYGGLDKITNTLVAQGQERKAEKKKEALELANKQEQMGAQFQQATIDMAPHMKTLGPDAWAATKTEVGGLREQMNEAIAGDDKDAQVEIMAKLNEIKSNAVKNKDGYESIISAHEEGLFDSKSMTPEGIEAHDNFLNNPSKRFVPGKDGKGAGYEWDVLDENGERVQALTPAGDPLFNMVNGNKEPVYETKSYTIDEINDFGVMPDTENGIKVNDYVQSKQELFNKGTITEYADVQKEMGNIIPKTVNELRSWGFGNPTENTNLNVHDYLMDHPVLNESQYKDLGVTDKNGDGVINEEDVISAEDREALIESIMNVDNPSVTRDIYIDMYATIAHNSIMGKEGKNYNAHKQIKMDAHEKSGATMETEMASKQQNLANEIQKGPRSGESKEVWANRLKIKPSDLVWNDDTKKWMSLSSESGGSAAAGNFNANSYKKTKK